MKLKEFNIDNCNSSTRSAISPLLSIDSKVGLFRFNLNACELMGISDESQIKFHQDEEDPECWYIEVVKDKGFVVRHKDNIGKGVLFNNAKLAMTLFDSVGYTERSGRCLIAGQPTVVENRKLFGILTASLRNK